ncbi:hypothetical protein F5X68DRAFT_206450, partial [Plectosphaerella plurivora]
MPVTSIWAGSPLSISRAPSLLAVILDFASPHRHLIASTITWYAAMKSRNTFPLHPTPCSSELLLQAASNHPPTHRLRAQGTGVEEGEALPTCSSSPNRMADRKSQESKRLACYSYGCILQTGDGTRPPAADHQYGWARNGTQSVVPQHDRPVHVFSLFPPSVRVALESPINRIFPSHDPRRRPSRQAMWL